MSEFPHRRKKKQSAQPKLKSIANRRLRIAAYLRVSTSKQTEEGESLAAQKAQINQFIRSGGFDVESIDYFVDEGRSGKDQNRPELQRLRERVASGFVDLVLCKHLDRLSRSVHDGNDLIDFFTSHGISFMTLDGNGNHQSMDREIMTNMHLSFAQHERRMIQTRTKTAMDHIASEGCWPGKAPFGYVKASDGSRKLTIDSESSEIVKRHFFDAYEDLGSLRALQRKLASLGIRPPVAQSGKRRGGQSGYSIEQLRRLLTNPAYVGHVDWGDVFVENAHPAIISEQQFARVQAKLCRARKTRTNPKHTHRKYVYRLAGLVVCGCGAKMAPKASRSKGIEYPYYVCTNQVHFRGTTKCNAPQMPARALDEETIDRLRSMNLNVEDRQRIREEAFRQLDDDSQKVRAEMDAVRKRLTTVTTEIGNLVDVVARLGATCLQSIQEKLTNLEAEQSALRDKLDKLAKAAEPVNQVTDAAHQFVENWTDVGDLLQAAEPAEQKEIIRCYVAALELRFHDKEKKRADYTLHLYPELGGLNQRPLAVGPEGPESPAPLTTDAKLRRVVEKAPRAQPSS
tara:strand:+ start:3481 stop:5190 length:1710 start_codon:yes stop_codon:yes gene_type:complete